jgi:hypothetical protein
MGNFLRGPNSNQRYPTPHVAMLTSAEINLIKATWKIPSSKVSEEREHKIYIGMIYEIIAAIRRC